MIRSVLFDDNVALSASHFGDRYFHTSDGWEISEPASGRVRLEHRSRGLGPYTVVGYPYTLVEVEAPEAPKMGRKSGRKGLSDLVEAEAAKP